MKVEDSFGTWVMIYQTIPCRILKDLIFIAVIRASNFNFQLFILKLSTPFICLDIIKKAIPVNRPWRRAVTSKLASSVSHSCICTPICIKGLTVGTPFKTH
jgi:hypothetical protein